MPTARSLEPSGDGRGIITFHIGTSGRWITYGGVRRATFAVKAFFIVSGFYMALVIDTRYFALPVSKFYMSRALRLFPLYWAVSILTLAAEFLLVPKGEYLHRIASPLAYGGGVNWDSMPWTLRIYIGIALVTMIGLRHTEIGLALMVLAMAITYYPIYYVFRSSFALDTIPYLVIAAGIPFLFKLTKDNLFDANIGELSYPIYMSHGLVLGLIRWSPLHDALAIAAGWTRTAITIALVIAVAFLLDRLIVLPIDKVRLRFDAKKRVQSAFVGRYEPAARASDS